jgi:hypothetical protein
MNRTASSTVNGVRPAINELAYWQQLVASLQIPPYVWVGMVLLAAAGLCYSLMLHTRAELELANKEHYQITERLKSLEVENARLARELIAVEKDPRTIEVLARQAGMVKSGESVVLIERHSSESSGRTGAAQATQ